MKDHSFKLHRGRPVNDSAWSNLVNQPLFFLENDEDENIRLLNDLEDQYTPHGCLKTWRSETTWRCQFFIGGSTRILGKGTLYQCAKLYDYALVLFEKYRVRKSVEFNFSKSDAESEILNEPAIRRYFESLEHYLLEAKFLKSEAEVFVAKEIQSATAKEKQRAKNHKLTIAGTIETWMEEFQPHIFDIAAQNDETAKRLTAVESSLAEIKEKLDRLLTLMNIPAT